MNSMRFGMYLWVCRMIILLKPRVLLGFHLNPKMMASKVGKKKTPMTQESHEILSLRMNPWLIKIN